MKQELTFRGELDRAIAEFGHGRVFAYFDDAAVTYGLLRDRVNSVANALIELGVRPGDRVGLFGSNCARWFEFWLAVPSTGARSVPVNVAFRQSFLALQMTEPKVSVLFVDASLVPHIAELADQLIELRVVIVHGELTAPPGLPASISVVDSETLYRAAVDAPPAELALQWHEPYCIFYTSGTTGPAKGAVVTQHYLLCGARSIAAASHFDPSDVLYGAMPLFHFGGSVGHALAGLVSGATVVLDSHFSVSAFWSRIEQHAATVFVGVGPMVMMLWSQPPAAGDADSSLRLFLAAPIPVAVHREVEHRYGVRVRGVYGMTELFPLCLQDYDDPTTPGAAGRPNAAFELALVDEHDHPVDVGEVGEIVARPRDPQVMFEGYENRATDTLASVRNMWFHTGDLARLNAEGDLYFVDRKKDAIRRRGENISSFQIEAVVGAHASVSECAAHAVPSEVGEDDVKVCVVIGEGARLTPDELHTYCAEQMPRFMVPRYLEFVEQLPKTMTGRVRKVELRERGVTSETWDAALIDNQLR